MPAETRPPSPDEEIAAAYREHFGVLEYLAIQRFHIVEDDVRGVIHDVFLAFIRNRHRIHTDERAWLVGAMCIQCRLYWRARGRDDVLCALDDESLDVPSVAADISTRIEISSLLRRLPRKCRELLRLRFFEEFSSEEIAKRFETTTDYARKLVYRCMSSARALYGRTARKQP
jgi:RNA polymerase sigma factor (sigma-70 family)